MTEDDWFAGADPTPLLEYLGPRASDRKVRLFACGCCRAAWNPFVGPLVVRVVRAAEAFTDGELGPDELARARAAAVAALARARAESGYQEAVTRAAAYATYPDVRRAAPFAAATSAAAAADRPLRPEGDPTSASADLAAERAWQCGLARCVFGNPFRPVMVDPDWLTSTVIALAAGIYAQQAFGRLPILADALMDAGCDEDELLDHLRGPGPHALGCWAVDVLLGKS